MLFNVGMKSEPRMTCFQIKPYMLKDDEGQKFHSLGALVVVKAGSEQTGGAFNLLEIMAPAGFATSLNIHYAEDVALFVLEGKLTIYWGDEMKEASAGSYFFQPRGTPYGFRVTGELPAKVLYLTMPGGLDRLVRERGLSPQHADATAMAARYQIEILGPLPE